MLLRSLQRRAIVGALAGCIATTTPALAGPAVVGSKAPAFELESLTGQPVNSKAFAGRALFVNVFATWCPPCRLEMPLIARTLPHYAKSVAFLAVDAQEASEIVKPFLARVGVRSAVAIDRGQFAATFGATSIPESIFIDRHGTVRAIVHGPIDRATLHGNLALIAR
ncbi:MAG: TlpA family protein disulfide reductase [Candidatus Eremiobacteraeota bacterium]|nr:TlpA family protein disulfide reductase [Candidatus Eremiobacteraeota bacterium]